MIKKESLKRIFIDLIHNKVKDELSNLGFLYSKSKGIFVKPKNEFDQIISISPNSATVEYDEFKDEVQLHFRIISVIEIPKFEKWCDKEYGQNGRINHSINNFKYFYRLSDSDLDLLETYTPTKSQLFKTNVSRSISVSRTGQEQIISFDEIKKYGFKLFVSNLHLFCNAKLLYANKNNKNDLTYIRMLEFLGEFELAKIENLRVLEEWREYINNTDFQSISDKNLALNSYNSRVKIINERFSTNINPIVENILPFRMYHQNSSKIQGSTIKLQHGYSIINPSSKIIKFHQIGDFLFQVREDGSVIKHDKNGIILDNHQTISYNINSQNSINISRNSKVLFFNDIVVKENGFIPLIYNTDIKKNGLIQPVPYSQVYIPQRNMYAFLISNYKNHEMHFFSNEGVSITKIQFLEKPIEIIPEIEIVLCEKEDKSCEVYSLDGVHKYSMPSNNARYSFKQHYDYNLNTNLFLSAWYHTKSQLYKLSTGEFVKHLWAHTTNMPGYKEKLYPDIHHNFGMSTFKFSPNGDYIVGGADHGKYVAWTTNDLNRYELIPDEPYLQRLGNAEIIEFEGQRILKNRGNEMWKILFFAEGNYFGFQVKKDLLIWDSKFNHIDTILDLGYVNNIIEDQLFVENEDKIDVYKLTL